MKMNEIISLIQGLSQSQGMYGRLLNYIYELDETDFNDLKNEWESKNFKDDLDFIFYIEC